MSDLCVSCLDVFAENVRDVIRAQAPANVVVRFANSYAEEEQMRLAEDSDVLLVGGATVSTEMIDRAKRLRFIQKWGIGVDKIDLNAARARGIGVAITAGANAGPVSELALALMLAVNRRVAYADRNLRQGHWLKPEMRGTCYQIDGKVVGLLGFGAIARMLALRLKGFDATILYYDIARADRATERALNARFASFDEVLTSSDILSLHTPLTPATKNMLGASELARMKPGAILINTARGGIIDEQALYQSLVSGHLRGAGLDAFAIEPLGQSKLLELDQVVLTPHAGGGVFDNVENVARHALSNVFKVANKEPLAPADIVVAGHV